ncbi:response regulator transcription factor [Desulfothermobacter acidiphilus]|uniref:response regulator transcription factor n=1 Tax=Desulfothermobacter acidiphilus TaxID=1938353 RepID=UPI003F8B5764
MSPVFDGIRILVVDDEQRIREILRKYLLAEGFKVGEAADGQEAIEQVNQQPWDLIILDLMLPGKDGWEVCREIRKHSQVPILMLTARGGEVDRVVGLELGADDYIVKPFSPREVVARVKAVLRRTRAFPDNQQRLQLSELTIEPESRRVLIGDKPLSLTPKEFDLLFTMARFPGRVFRREELLDLVWGYDFCGDSRTVDTHIARLREKLSQMGSSSLIVTVWGVGYKVEAPHAKHSG